VLAFLLFELVANHADQLLIGDDRSQHVADFVGYVKPAVTLPGGCAVCVR
jgi:hypothetical protein